MWRSYLQTRDCQKGNLICGSRNEDLACSSPNGICSNRTDTTGNVPAIVPSKGIMTLPTTTPASSQESSQRGSDMTDCITKMSHPTPCSRVQSNVPSSNRVAGSKFKAIQRDILSKSIKRTNSVESTSSTGPQLPTSELVALYKTVHTNKRSKMVNCKMYKPCPHNPDPILTENSYRKKLLQFTTKHRLDMPDYANFYLWDPNRNETLYMSCVKIGAWSYSSISLESTNLNWAQEYAAQKALEDLSRRVAEKEASLCLETTSDARLIIERITDIVSDHYNGLKAEFVETTFRNVYGEKLPPNWLEIITSDTKLSVERLINGFYLYPQMSNFSNVSELPPLILPESNTWNIFVTVCHSSQDVYFRLTGPDYDEKYDVLVDRMETNYDAKGMDLQPATTIVDGCYYATCLENNWFRIKILSGDLANKRYRVYLVDHGSMEEVSADCIFPLDNDLTDLPAQAIRCGLTLLENFNENKTVSSVLQAIIQHSSVYIAKVDSRNPDLKLTLYDTRTEVHTNLNAKLRKKIDQCSESSQFSGKILAPKISKSVRTSSQEDDKGHVQIPSSPKVNQPTYTFAIPPFPLPVDRNSMRLRVSMVMNRGHFIIQPLEYKDELGRMEEEMRKYYSIHRPQADVATIQGGNVFAVQSDEKEWRRGLVIGVLQEMGEVLIKFVDYGTTITVSFRMVYYLMPCFRKNPALAMEAQLAGIAPVRSPYWTMKDCLFFHDLLVNKEFFGIIVNVYDEVVSLRLFDDTIQDGVSSLPREIGAQLVKGGRAVEITKIQQLAR